MLMSVHKEDEYMHRKNMKKNNNSKVYGFPDWLANQSEKNISAKNENLVIIYFLSSVEVSTFLSIQWKSTGTEMDWYIYIQKYIKKVYIYIYIYIYT